MAITSVTVTEGKRTAIHGGKISVCQNLILHSTYNDLASLIIKNGMAIFEFCFVDIKYLIVHTHFTYFFLHFDCLLKLIFKNTNFKINIHFHIVHHNVVMSFVSSLECNHFKAFKLIDLSV